MKPLLLLFATSAAFFCFLSAATALSDRANLIVQKSLFGETAVVDEELPVIVRVFNVGESTAYDITFEDPTWTDAFELAAGLRSAHWDKLAAGANVSHVFVVRPKRVGIFQTLAAKLLYRNSPNGPTQTGFSSTLGKVSVESHSEHAKRNAAHYKEWSVFALLAGLSIAPAAWVWYSLASTAPKASKKEKKRA